MQYPKQFSASSDALVPVRTAIEARQGVTGHKVRYVLAWGTGLAALAMGGLFIAAVYFGKSF
jgi:hypothetical protein